MIDEVKATIKRYNMLNKGDGVLVGVSGGPDSLTLLYIIKDLEKEYNLRIYAAHINHCLRDNESDLDEEFVKFNCENLGVPLFCKRVDVDGISKSKKISLEEAGRFARYEFFEEISKKINAQKIAVAHNANDNAETILMRITRGCGLDGLCGIKPVRDNIIRPLIEIKREDIESYCKDNNLNPRIDLSNLDKTYTRNKIRLELIPYLEKEFNEKIINIINRMSNLVCLDAEYINLELQKIMKEIIIKQNEEYIIVNLDKINKQSEFIIPKILRLLILELQGNLVEIEQINVLELMKFIKYAKTGSKHDLPKGLKVKKSYNELTIYKNNNIIEARKYSYSINIPGNTLIEEVKTSIDACFTDSLDVKVDKYTQFFDYDKIKDSLFVRTRMDGDVFSPSGMRGTKKVKDYFIDKKIPKEDREQIPIIATKNEVVWIIGERISEKYKVDNTTKKILVLKYNL